MNPEEYYVVHPRQPIDGCLAVVVRGDMYSSLEDVEKRQERKRLIARAYLSDHIPMHGSINEILSRSQYHDIKIAQNPQPIYLHHGGSNVTFYDLCAGGGGKLNYIEVEVDTELSSAVFGPVRTAVNQLIDTIQRGRALPLVISRIDLHEKGVDEPFAHQLILPYPAILNIGPIGGLHQHPAFTSYEAVLREAILSSSPYYRFLCAYRLYEGLKELKRWLKEAANNAGVSERLPKDPKINKDLLIGLGFEHTEYESVSNISDLWNKFTPLRNQVAHFFTNSGSQTLHLSSGHSYMEYSVAAAILLHYANATFEALLLYFNRNLSGRLSVGSVLATPDIKERFLMRV